MKLQSKFNVKNVATVGNLHDFLSEETLRRVVPAIYAPHKSPARSDKYLFIPTSDIVDGLAREGFRPVFAASAKPRDPAKRGFTKHLLRFRREADIYGKGDAIPEIVLSNSHGGESQLQEFGGVFRFICLNSMVSGETYENVVIRHTGKLVDQAIEGAYRIASHFGAVMNTVEEWRQLRLTRDQQVAFAASATELRVGENVEGETQRLFDADEFLTVRRPEDDQPDLWRTFNRVQENLMVGGAEGVLVSPIGKRRRTSTKPVNGIDMNLRLNRALWTLGERMAKLAA